jgi:uncharacterized protein (TIGR03086 family)
VNTAQTNSMEKHVRPESVLDSLTRVHDEIGGLVASTDPARLEDRTPCSGWDVRALINHLVHLNLRYAAMADGKDIPGPDQDYLGNDYAQAYRKAARSSIDAFSRDGMLEQRYPSPWGEMNGAVLAQHVVNELVAHGWDLAKALGRPTNIVPDIAAESSRIWREWFADIGRQPGFEPEKRAPAGSGPADEMAAFLGRPVE